MKYNIVELQIETTLWYYGFTYVIINSKTNEIRCAFTNYKDAVDFLEVLQARRE